MSNSATPEKPSSTTQVCMTIVERRSGYGWTSGAGDRAGAHTALCGKPTVEGSSMCKRHLALHKKMLAKLEARRNAAADNGSRSTR